MRVIATGTGLLFVALIVSSRFAGKTWLGRGAYCPNPDHATPGKVPPDLMGAVAATFQIDTDAVRNAAFVRCVGAKLMGCYIGANLDCDKAETRRSLPGATAWCRGKSRFKDHSDVGDRSRHDLRVVLQGPPRSRRKSHGDGRSAGIYRRQLARNPFDCDPIQLNRITV